MISHAHLRPHAAYRAANEVHAEHSSVMAPRMSAAAHASNPGHLSSDDSRWVHGFPSLTVQDAGQRPGRRSVSPPARPLIQDCSPMRRSHASSMVPLYPASHGRMREIGLVPESWEHGTDRLLPHAFRRDAHLPHTTSASGRRDAQALLGPEDQPAYQLHDVAMPSVELLGDDAVEPRSCSLQRPLPAYDLARQQGSRRTAHARPSPTSRLISRSSSAEAMGERHRLKRRRLPPRGGNGGPDGEHQERLRPVSSDGGVASSFASRHIRSPPRRLAQHLPPPPKMEWVASNGFERAHGRWTHGAEEAGAHGSLREGKHFPAPAPDGSGDFLPSERSHLFHVRSPCDSASRRFSVGDSSTLLPYFSRSHDMARGLVARPDRRDHQVLSGLAPVEVPGHGANVGHSLTPGRPPPQLTQHHGLDGHQLPSYARRQQPATWMGPEALDMHDTAWELERLAVRGYRPSATENRR